MRTTGSRDVPCPAASHPEPAGRFFGIAQDGARGPLDAGSAIARPGGLRPRLPNRAGEADRGAAGAGDRPANR